jgi:hypothetical protein
MPNAFSSADQYTGTWIPRSNSAGNRHHGFARRHQWQLFLAAVGLVAAAGCSGDKSTKAITVASGTANGSAWSLVTFHDKAGALCMEIRDGADKSDAGFGDGCAAWESSTGTHVQDPYVDGPGPAGSEFAFGPLVSAVTTVEATAPGKQPLVAQAQALRPNRSA